MRYQLEVRVNPGTTHRKATWRNDHLKVNLKSPPKDGRANEELINYVTKLFDLRSQDVSIIHGKKRRKKTLRLEYLDREQLVRQMNSLSS